MLCAITLNAVIFESFLTGVVINTLCSAFGIGLQKKCKYCILENYETVEKLAKK